MSKINLRAPQRGDIESVGRIIYQAFGSIAGRHNFQTDFPALEHGVQVAEMVIGSSDFIGVVAEVDGKVVGSNFIDQRDQIGGIGPITVDPDQQAKGVGRRLMQAVMEKGRQQPHLRGQRLVQDAFNTASMSLYASLGFEVREPLALMAGVPRDAKTEESVRPMSAEDVEACDALCREVHGISRANELRAAVAQFRPYIAVRNGQISAYCTAPGFWLLNHGVARSEQDMHALLLGAAAGESQLSLLVPVRQANLFRWCLTQGMRVIKPMNLMSMGEYHQPTSTYFPSVQY